MDYVWLVLDSLSYEAASVCGDGSNTMPGIRNLAEDYGIIYENAYAPGPYSPSSHASFFTGKLPSEAGMNDANPFFEGQCPTIAEVLSNTHQTSLISSNPFIFNGLDKRFDNLNNLQSEPYHIFEGGTNPRKFEHRNPSLTGAQKYQRFLRSGGTPIRSLINGMAFKLWYKLDGTINSQKSSGSDEYQHASYINKYIREAINRPNEQFLLANYMDVHPPFKPSDEALEIFGDRWEREELPTGNSARDPGTYNQEAMYDLYLASIFDLDKKLTPLIEFLVEQNTVVFLTSDHGPWFSTKPLEEERLHVPLIIFSEHLQREKISSTVSIRSLPHTTEAILSKEGSSFDGYNLLDVKEDQIVISEYIHQEESESNTFSINSNSKKPNYEAVLRKGHHKVTYTNNKWKSNHDYDCICNDLELHGKDLVSDLEISSKEFKYDRKTEERLENLGYL